MIIITYKVFLEGIYMFHHILGLDLEKPEESRSPDVLTAAVSSTVAAFLVISLFTFVAGFVCGHHFGRKYKQSS